MKKVLVVSTIAPTVAQFNMNNIHILNSMGYQVDVACNYVNTEMWSQNKIKEFEKEIRSLGGQTYQIDFSRRALEIGVHIKTLWQLISLLKRNRYTFIHTHTPIASAITRVAAHKANTKVVYTAHGFHFYKGAPLKNWVLFFPIEFFCSYWTDILITINHEDYKIGKKFFHAKKVIYVPGVGIDIQKYENGGDRRKKRAELGVGNEEIMYLSVGELSSRKNHEVVIRAIALMQNKNVKYFIAGKGELQKKLKILIHDLNLDEQVKLLGFRRDISELCRAADFFVFPSLQEGLPVALMEAIASKTFVICSNIRGNRELAKDTRFIFNAKKARDISECMERALKLNYNEKMKIIDLTYKGLEEYTVETINYKMEKIFEML